MAKEMTLSDLPNDALHRVLNALDCASLARISCTCKELDERASQPLLWEERCKKRWRVQETGTWKRLASKGLYKELYAKKHGVRSSARANKRRLQDIDDQSLYHKYKAAQPSPPGQVDV